MLDFPLTGDPGNKKVRTQ